MTNDGLNTITYDGEGRAVTASGGLGSGTYTYDGNGLRVKKVASSTTTVYIFSGAKVIAEYANGAAPSSPTREYVYAGGALLARIDSSGTNYYHQDHLSNRMVTNSSGSVVAEMGHFPFGESWYNATNDKLYFTTYEYDSESGNHYAMARYHVSRLGRLSSPDPLAGSTANPQSLNRYSYSINDPANLTDPSGAQSNGCTTAEKQPTDKSQQASGGGHSDPDNSDAETDGDAGNADPPQQNGCVSHTDPTDWFDPFGGGTMDGGFAGDDSGGLPGGGFQVGGSDLASEIALEGFGACFPNCDPTTERSIYTVIMLWTFGPPNNDGNPGEAAIKEAIANLLKNPRCAGLFGGPTKASAILGKMAGPFDVSPGSGYIARFPLEMAAVSSVNDSRTPSPSASIWGHTASGAWNGGPGEVLVGKTFNSQPFQAQLTIILHEMLHAAMPNASALIDTPAPAGNSSAYWISRDCGTALPNLPDLAIPTTPAPISTTLVPPGS
ncbi:MAG TPA: RHS repeat-associated core domain-containing protein [Candidatus Acidoferrales bacterium]|nr:RHS repeat-associated core domain-containing protein [Candidatus Acidoferrales bacterium]